MLEQSGTKKRAVEDIGQDKSRRAAGTPQYHKASISQGAVRTVDLKKETDRPIIVTP